MKTIIIAICVIISVLLAWSFVGKKRMSPAEKSLHELTDIFAKKGKSKFGLSTYGSGGGTDGKINFLDIHFAYQGKMSVDEARCLIVDVTHELLEELERNKKYRPYLHEISKRIKTLTISIAFRNEETALKTGLHFVSTNEGTVVYTMTDPDDPKKLRIKNFLYESFEEAEQIVAEQRAAQLSP